MHTGHDLRIKPTKYAIFYGTVLVLMFGAGYITLTYWYLPSERIVSAIEKVRSLCAAYPESCQIAFKAVNCQDQLMLMNPELDPLFVADFCRYAPQPPGDTMKERADAGNRQLPDTHLPKMRQN